MAGNDTVRPRCDYHCAHRTDGNNLGMFVGVYCCWCGKKERVAITVEEIPLPGHGTYSAAKTVVYDWPRGWDIREVPHAKSG